MSVVPLHLVTNDRCTTDLVGNERAQGHVRIDALGRQAIQRCNRFKLGVSFEYKIAEETQIEAALRRLAEQFSEGAKVVFMADNAQ
ncbi:hypothetical protein D3C87_1476450 [compost metagenome]